MTQAPPPGRPPDYFSSVATVYAQSRPHYPEALFTWLATLPGRRTLAWDCAAGSGQASVALAEHFDQVIATDISAAQLERAPAHSRITYRVAPGEALAVWTYGTLVLEDEAANQLAQAYYRDTVGPYWPPERRLVEDGYRSVKFPYQRIAAPAFEMALDWTLAQLLAYFRSWSATARYIQAQGHNPVDDLAPVLARAWGDPQARRRIRWPLTILAGRP